MHVVRAINPSNNYKHNKITSGQSNLKTGRMAAAHGWFNGIRQVAPVWASPNNAFLGPAESSTQTASWSVQPFLHRLPQSVPIFYNGPSVSPLKIAHSHGDLDSHLIYGSLGPPKSSTQMASWSWQTDRLTKRLTDRQTDRPLYSVCNNRPHLQCSTVMRPNNVTVYGAVIMV